MADLNLLLTMIWQQKQKRLKYVMAPIVRTRICYLDRSLNINQFSWENRFMQNKIWTIIELCVQPR